MIYDAMGSRKKHNTMADTWGHLYPQPGSKHQGFILIATGEDGTTIILRSEFTTLSCSPMRAHLESTALNLYNYQESGNKIWRLDCTLWFYKTSSGIYLGENIGKIIKTTLTELLDLDLQK